MNIFVKHRYLGVQLKSYFVIVFLGALCFTSVTQAVEQTGSYVVNYGAFLGGDERQEAEEKAIQNAIERWVAEKNPAHYENYKRMQATINSNVRDYILDFVSEADRDRDAKTYRVMARVNINEPKLLDTLLGASEAVAGESEYITFVFVAREQVASRKRSQKESTMEKEQANTIAKDRADNEATQTKRQSQTVRREDSEVVYKDEAIWDVTTTNEVDAAMGQVFTEANYLVVDAALLEDETGHMLQIDNFINDYKVGSDISSQTRRDSVRGLQSVKTDPVRYFALGTLDVDEEIIDQQTGNIKVAVAVTGQVIDVKRRGAVVAKVGPETMFGEGPTSLVAKNNALKLAAEQVAKRLVAQLSSKDIR